MNRFFYTKLAATNLKNHAKTYIPYIIACIVTVMMYYIMGQLTNDDGLTKMAGSDSLKVILQLGSRIIGIMSVIFLFYINSFIMRRRKKEFGLFNVLGMEKCHISKIVCIEVVYVAIISLVLGLVGGFALSKLIQLLLLKLINFDVQWGFNISASAIISTVALFAAIFILTLLWNVFQIYRANPTELLHSGQIGEREPKTKWIMTVIGVIALGVGYYIAITTEAPLEAFQLFFIAVILVILGTYCLFTAGITALLKILKRNKRYYYKTKHFISVSGMIYRMKQNAVGLSTICILSTAVLIMISTTAALYIGVEDALRYRFQQNIYIEADNMSDGDVERLNAVIQDTLNTYGVNELNTESRRYITVSSRIENGAFHRAEDTLTSDINVLIMIPLSDYNRMTNQSASLETYEVLMYASDGASYRDKIVFGDTEFGVTPTVDLSNFTNDYSLGTDYFYVIFADSQTIVDVYSNTFSDSENSAPENLDYYYGFGTDADADTQIALVNALGQKLLDMGLDSAYAAGAEVSRASFYANYGGMLFLGIFLGLLFIMCTVLIIYYKQITEGYEDKSRYEIMQQVGMSRSEVRNTIHSQVLSVFFLPLVVSGIHVAASFKMITKLLELFNLTNIPLFALCAVGTLLAFALLYGAVYVLTSREYYRIVKM